MSPLALTDYKCIFSITCIGAVQEIHERTSEKIAMLETKMEKLEEIITEFKLKFI
jgi:hypothetical protein